MKNKVIGVFDSGLGGLTCVCRLSELLPNNDIVYFGDTGRVPYGTRSRETINRYAKEDISLLRRKNCDFIIAACGTVSANLENDYIDTLGENFTGVLIPACDKAIKTTKINKIGVIGTSATIKSGSYERYIKSVNKDISVISVACPLFVPLVENGYFDKDNKVTKLIAEEYLTQLKGKIDTLILGCTHYPLLTDAITNVLGKEVTLIDAGCAAAELVASKVCDDVPNPNRTITYYVSDTTDNFAKNASIFIKDDISDNVFFETTEE